MFLFHGPHSNHAVIPRSRIMRQIRWAIAMITVGVAVFFTTAATEFALFMWKVALQFRMSPLGW